MARRGKSMILACTRPMLTQTAPCGPNEKITGQTTSGGQGTFGATNGEEGAGMAIGRSVGPY